MHILAEKRKKLDSKAEKGLLVSRNEFGLYKVWVIERRTAVVVRHVLFIEETCPGREEFHFDEEQGEEPFSGTRVLPSNSGELDLPSQVSRESPPDRRQKGNHRISELRMKSYPMHTVTQYRRGRI